MGLSGNLRTVSFSDILQLLSTGKKTGLLEVQTSSRQKEVHFRDGNIIFASSVNATEDLLGNMLLSRGKISKRDLDRAITLHKQTGRQLGTTLVDMNIFDKEEITECLRLQIEEIVYNLFSWPEGDFIFHEGKQPKSAPFLVEMNTMSVVMEGTRRIDEWMEIQKVLPPDDVVLAVVRSPKINKEEIRLSLDEYKLLAYINGERTLPELISISPMGEFVTYRAIYQLILGKLVEAVGKREVETVEKEDEDEAALRLVFDLYNNSFYRIKTVVEELLGEENARFPAFAAQYRTGILTHFPGTDRNSDMAPSFDKFMTAVMAYPVAIRYYKLMSGLENMLAEQLEFCFQLLGIGGFREAVNKVKKEIAEPLAMRRELVKRYSIEENFYKTIKRADKVVKMVRG
ncbi:MAG: DUF4388 domain-containing protein [bacterium]|nr:DUF4388 domain-containing protein [bacterium]